MYKKRILLSCFLAERGIFMKFGELFDIHSGVTVRNGYKEECAKPVRIVLPKDVHANGNIDGHTVSVQKIYYKKEHLLRDGDILFCAKGTIKAAAFSGQPEDYVASSAFFILSPKRELFSAYIAAFLNSEMMKGAYRSATNGSTIPSLPISYVSGIQIRLPPLSAQKRVIELLDLYNEKLALLSRRTELETKARDTLFKKIFTGELV